MFPLANIEVQLGGMAFRVEAAVSDRLPMSVLLCTDVPQLVELLNGVGREPGLDSDGGEAMDVLVMTRSQRAAQEQVEEQQREKQLRSGVQPSPVDGVTVDTVGPLRDDPDDGVAVEYAMIGAEFGDDLFQSKKVRPKMTRAQKRANKHNYHGERPHKQLGTFGEVSLTRAEVERLQADTVGASRVWRCRAGCGAVGVTRTVPNGCTGGVYSAKMLYWRWPTRSLWLDTWGR